MICTHHRPASRMAMPISTTHVTARRCGSFFFSWSKTIIEIANCQLPISLLSPFDLPVRPEARLGQRPIVQGLSETVKKTEPNRRHRSAREAHHEPLPERKPADERLAFGVDEQ